MPTYIKWPAPSGGVRLEYAPELLERLRLLSIDGLLALPRVGVAIGGFLTGSMDQGKVRVSDVIEIPCSHANGPAFALTGPEIARASALAFGEGHRQVVGWYCSKPRGELALNPQLAALFREICPQPWQMGLLIRPSTVEPTRAAVCSPDGSRGYIVGSAMELKEYVPPVHHAAAEVLSPEVLPPVAESVPMVKTEPMVTPMQEVVAEPRPIPPPVPVRAREETREESAIRRAPARARVAREIPIRETTERTSRLVFLLAALAVALLAFLYINRFTFLPRPPLEVTITEEAGQVTVRWNPEALQGVEEASMLINDGGQLQTLSLNRQLLSSGWVRAPRKSGRVIARLTAGDITGLTVWSAPAPAAEIPAKPAPEGATAPANAAAPAPAPFAR